MNNLESQPDSGRILGRVAAALAMGAVVGSRLRPTGVALFAGAAAWAALRKLAPKKVPLEPTSKVEPTPFLPPPAPAAEWCPPSEPFIDKEESWEDEPNWDKLRAALIPPPSLFTPPVSPPPTNPEESSLLSSAPLFVEKSAPLVPSPQSEEKAIIPDTVSFPEPPNPFLGKFVGKPLSGSPPSPQVFPKND